MDLLPDVEQASDSLVSGWRYFLLSPRINGAYNSLMMKDVIGSTQYYLLIVILEMDRSFQDAFTQTPASTSPVVLSLQLHFHFLPFVDSSKHSIMTRRMLLSDSLSLKGMHLEVRSHSFREVGIFVFLPRNKIASALMSCLSSKEY